MLMHVVTARPGFFLLLSFSDHFLQWSNACPRKQWLPMETPRLPPQGARQETAHQIFLVVSGFAESHLVEVLTRPGEDLFCKSSGFTVPKITGGL